MRLLQSVLTRLEQTKKPQHKFVTHLLRLMLMLPGRATFRHLSHYSPSHERTFLRWYDRDLDWVSLNKAAITAVVPPEHDQALVMDASFVFLQKRQVRPMASFACGNGSHSRTEKGLEISTLAWLDITVTCTYCLSVEQTPPSADAPDPEATRMDVYLDQLIRVVTTHDLSFLRYVVTDGAYSKQKFVGGGASPWGCIRLASGEPMPICAISTRDRSTRGRAATSPTTARCTGMTAIPV